MGNSLQDQLIGAGLVDKKKANKLKAEQHKKRRQKRKAGEPQTAEKPAGQRVKENAAKDRELNRRREHQRARKAVAAQVRQLVAAHGIAEEKEAEDGYNFVDQGKVKKIYVSEQSRAAIGSGKLAIVRVDRRYRLIPSEHVEKLRQRDAGCIVLHNASPQESAAGDDEYPEHKVPDDLMW